MKLSVYTRQMMIADERNAEKPFLMEIIEQLVGCKCKHSNANRVYGEPDKIYVMSADGDDYAITETAYSEMSLLDFSKLHGIIFAVGNLIEFRSDLEIVVYEKLL